MSKKANRRHQFFRWRQRVRKFMYNVRYTTWEFNGGHVTDEDVENSVRCFEKNRKRCSCWLCQRKGIGRQEQRQRDKVNQQIDNFNTRA